MGLEGTIESGVMTTEEGGLEALVEEE